RRVGPRAQVRQRLAVLRRPEPAMVAVGSGIGGITRAVFIETGQNVARERGRRRHAAIMQTEAAQQLDSTQINRKRAIRLRHIKPGAIGHDFDFRTTGCGSRLPATLLHEVLAMTPQHILKRDGRVVPFDGANIVRAIAAAGRATGEVQPSEADILGTRVAARLSSHPCPGIETIQNIVEEVLVEAGHWKTARAYIVYRERHARLRTLRHTLVDVESSMEEYLDQRDWRVNANANQGYSLGGLILNVAGKVTANYWLSHVYDPAAGQAHRDGDIHIHDLDMLSGYCAGWSLRQLLTEGFNGVPGKVEATPPRHMSAAIGQIVNFLGTLQNEWAGAQAFSSFDTYMAPFVRRDNMSYAEVKQAMQELIYNLNVPSRWGTQTPFTNLTFDLTCPADLREQIPYIGGAEMPFS